MTSTYRIRGLQTAKSEQPQQPPPFSIPRDGPFSHYPGIDLELRHVPETQYPVGFPGTDGGESDTLQMREVAMMMLMDQITDKPNWQEKVFDESIVQKWRQEARTLSEAPLFQRIMLEKETIRIPQPKKIISEQCFEFCIAELRNKARYFRDSGIIPTLDSQNYCVVKSDKLMSEELRLDLAKAFATLQADQAANVDWHPNSGDVVQDLVHPSMYPFVYGKSLFIPKEIVGTTGAISAVGQGDVVSYPFAKFSSRREKRIHRYSGPENDISGLWSEKYQWLPANAAFRDGEAAFTSYINNLHPDKYQDIYKAIETALDVAIPLWDQCLREKRRFAPDPKPFGRSKSRFEQIDEASDTDPELWSEFDLEYHLHADIPVTEDLEDAIQNGWPELGENFWKAVEGKVKGYSTENLCREAKLSLQDEITTEPEMMLKEKRAYARWLYAREAKLPEPLPHEDIDYSPKESIRDKFRDIGLQIIVKMASIELTPEKPELAVGGWHLEGMANEKICATALFYIDSDNVADSRVSFRAQTRDDLNQEISAGQDAYNYLERVFGTGLGPSTANIGGASYPCLQTYGDVRTLQGRVLAFPNTLQHRVSSVKLQDPTRPGHRRFLALWLVDPHTRIVSTANVPPQQRAWWEETQDEAKARPRIGPRNLPIGLMTQEEACGHRLELMRERGLERRNLTLRWETDNYSFCEH